MRRLVVTGPRGQRKRGRGGSFPSPKERRTLWEAIRTTSSYPSSVPPQVPSAHGNRIRISCQAASTVRYSYRGQKREKSAGNWRNLPGKRGPHSFLRLLPKEDAAWNPIEAGARSALLPCGFPFQAGGRRSTRVGFLVGKVADRRGPIGGPHALRDVHPGGRCHASGVSCTRRMTRGGERGGSPLLSHRKGDRREIPLQCCGYTHRADKRMRMPEKGSICQIG